MNYEQIYNDALARAKDMLSYKEVRREDMEYIFPELKESEDERIKNEIIDYISTADDKELIPYESWIAWLEKQGEPKSVWHDDSDEPIRGSLILLIMQSGTPVVAKIIEPNHTFNHGERWAYIDDLIKL